jgi:hypothetical protein
MKSNLILTIPIRAGQLFNETAGKIKLVIDIGNDTQLLGTKAYLCGLPQPMFKFKLINT